MACYLIVVRQGFWQRVMDNIADIGFVDSHAKCYRCTDDLDFVSAPQVVVPGSFSWGPQSQHGSTSPCFSPISEVMPGK